MKLLKISLISLIAFFAVSSAAIASDFSWAKDFNIQAQADPSGFRAKLATRFNIGDVQVEAILSNCDRPADAYIMLRLGEMSGRTTDYVVEKYRKNKGKGWGAMAKSLGIKPGSKEFHALKRSQDLYVGNNHGQVHVSRNKRGMLTLLTLVIAKEKVSKGKK
jgi:hypothetical protein